MLRIGLFLQISLFFAIAYGYGFEYDFDPSTRESRLKTHVPGAEPIINWNGIADKDGKFNMRNWNPNDQRGEPNVKRYWDPQARDFKWTCKSDAVYSEDLKRCVWNSKYSRFN